MAGDCAGCRARRQRQLRSITFDRLGQRAYRGDRNQENVPIVDRRQPAAPSHKGGRVVATGRQGLQPPGCTILKRDGGERRPSVMFQLRHVPRPSVKPLPLRRRTLAAFQHRAQQERPHRTVIAAASRRTKAGSSWCFRRRRRRNRVLLLPLSGHLRRASSKRRLCSPMRIAHS